MQICSSYQKVLDDNTIDLDNVPPGSYNELDSCDDGGGEDDSLEEIDVGGVRSNFFGPQEVKELHRFGG